MPGDQSENNADGQQSHNLSRTALYDRHVALGAKMVPFAGYEMPVQYQLGVLKEHLWTREKAGLFDVSHMGIAHLRADDGAHETVARALEALVPADVLNLAPGQQRYTQLLNTDGGIIDDLMVARSADASHDGWLFLVVNASRKPVDYAHIAGALPADVSLLPSDDFVLMALQGPEAIEVIAGHDAAAREMKFMSARMLTIDGVGVHATRSGYTGEDGFELPVPVAHALKIWDALAGDARVEPIGLGARDSLRLEAGLCLYGHDIDETTSPIEAGLNWSIQKRRRVEGGFPGAARIQAELATGPSRKRVGVKPDGRAPAREGAVIHVPGGAAIGVVTSGGFGPSVSGPVAMGYVAADYAKPDTAIELMVRGKPIPATVVRLPFTPHGYAR
ncbi:MAG TPA: glycine cleavage system aminomethyltransferase GcvT [Hyphomicrobiaceae bacterium]|nr:glycine cleavage system aminomethyltransferase GcvT [Hyphomicrobiaceae bacterium]